MRRHCREQHGWVSPWVKGGNVRKKSREQAELPWIYGVQCQRFFINRSNSGWFEVNRNVSSEEAPVEDVAIESIRALFKAKEQELESNAAPDMIEAGHDKTEANAWLSFVGWAAHLQGLSHEQLHKTTGPIGEDEATLQGMWDTMEAMMDRARPVASPMKVGAAVLFDIQRKDLEVKPRRPFDNRMEEDTWVRYKEVYRKMMCVMQRSETMSEGERAPYRFTTRQGNAFDAFEEAVRNGGKAKEAGTQRLCLEFVISLFDHPLKAGHYDNAVISALAVLATREDGGWADVLEYTTTYSAVIKIIRILAVYEGYLEREDEVRALREAGVDEEEASEQASSIFSKVRGKVGRYLTRTSGQARAEPTPLDWIFEARTYGMHIRYNTAAPGSIDWVGDRISRGPVSFTMGQLSEMLHGIAREARELLLELAMTAEGGLPTIQWARLEDDQSCDRVGYSFLSDDRNRWWVEKGKDWVWSRIEGCRERYRWWVRRDGAGGCPFKGEAVRKYGIAVDQFRERLFVLMHMLSMPARVPEISGIRFVNTANGGVRNIMAHNQMISFITSYHKGYRITGEAKVIHRYMPREVGELMVWYLWIVLPFWQTMQGIIQGGSEASKFMWADEVVRAARVDGTRAKDKEDDKREGIEEEDGEERKEKKEAWEQLEDRVWSNDRARRTIQRHSERLLGARLTISAWRHLAVGIANRFLNKSFKQEDGGEGDDEWVDDVEDNMWDVQTGHGTRIAGMIYARELQQGVFGTAQRREQFRGVSRQWHRFLGFGDEDSRPGRGAGLAGCGLAGSKRVRDPFEEMRQDAQFRRFAQLQRVNIGGQLRMMMGAEARFRGRQREVIEAIVGGESPVLQIAGTGEGKSLSFMLPAFCSPEGTTIVVVPLVSLREDLHERCRALGIETHIWQSRQGHRPASMVFVTPESAVTKGFGEFVKRLQGRQALDRVVVDECHTILDGARGFRPQLRRLGETLSEWGVQRVFLTATLGPEEEMAFYRAADLLGKKVRVYRSRTTRRNIAYRVEVVREPDEDGAADRVEARVKEVVEDWQSSRREGRIIVYGDTVDRVERMGVLLGCPVYHSRVDTSEGKARRLQSWREKGDLIVATNALGLGIDVPDVRLVVHAGMPRRIRDYAQESGRAGRDGGASQAVVVTREGYGQEESAAEFIKGQICRREVLDMAMDGHVRAGCEEDEEYCDVCRVRYQGDPYCVKVKEEEGEEARYQAVARFSMIQGERRVGRWEAEGKRMQRSGEAEEFRRYIRQWGGLCVVCWTQSTADVPSSTDNLYHIREECPLGEAEDGWKRAEGVIGKFRREIFEKRRFERMAGCYWCGLPQALCERWRAINDEEGERFVLSQGQCQYGDVLVGVMGMGEGCLGEEARQVWTELAAEEGVEAEVGSQEWFQWLGQATRWGGLEANMLCRAFHRLCRRIEEMEVGLRL